MQMLLSDWLSHSYTISHWNAVAAGRPRNAMFYSFSEVLEGILDVNGYLIPDKTKRSTFTAS